MTLFFVLSGFVIHYNYGTLVTDGRLRGIGLYLRARFARLYPLFLLMLLVNVLISSRHLDFWRGHPERLDSILQALPYFVTSVQSWFYLPIEENALISAIGGGSPLTWSISTEWFFYFIYPCIASLILSSQRPWVTAALAMLWCALWIGLSTSLYDQSPQIDAWAVQRFGPVASMQTNDQDSLVRWLLYQSPYLRVGEFVLGTFIAQLYMQLRNQPVTKSENGLGTLIFLLAAASVIVVTYLEYSPDVGQNVFRKMNMNFALAPASALIMFCVARYQGLIFRPLSLPLVIILGEASYSIYLLHYVVLLSVERLIGGADGSLIYDLARLVCTMVAILIASVLLYRFYEDPARRWLRQRARKGRMSAEAKD